MNPVKDNSDRNCNNLDPADIFEIKAINLPMTILECLKLEKQKDIAISIVGWENDSVVVHRLSKQPDHRLLYTESKIKYENTSLDAFCTVIAEKTC